MRGVMMLKVAICDDMPHIADSVEELLFEYHATLFEAYVYYNANKLMQQMKETHFDIYILDIEMPKNNGIEMAKLIREKNMNVPIVFLTSFKNYMEEVFKIQTFDYIVKPLTKERFFPLLDRLTRYLDANNASFHFTYNKKDYHILFKDILYFEKNGRQVFIHTDDKVLVSNMTTSEVLAKLQNTFVQIHHSFIVNSRYIKEIGKSYLVIKSEKNKPIELPISRKFKEEAYQKIIAARREQL
jgi:DNA-binding LytR/AlgR family response regulator